MMNASSSRAAAEATASSEVASLSDVVVPIAAAPIPVAIVSAQSEAAIYTAGAFIHEAASSPVNTKVSLSDLL